MKKTITGTELLNAAKSAKSALIIGHMRPDGDCLGAGFAMKHFLQRHGVSVDFVCDSDKPEHYSFFEDYDSLNNKKLNSYDAVFCVDCGDEKRLGRYGTELGKSLSYNIDHHVTNKGYADYNYVVSDASSTCELVFDLLDSIGEVDDYTAFCLYVGLSTDTGHFMHDNTNAKVLLTGSKLLEHNIDASRIVSLLYRNNTVNKTMLIGRAVRSMKFFHDDKICVISITANDLQETGCVLADTEGLTDYGMNIGKVLVTVCISEQFKSQYKVSFRSKSIDVGKAAAVFGGGGHVKASGCVVNGHYEDVVRKVVKAVADGFSV